MGMFLTVGEQDALKRFCGRRSITYASRDDVSYALEGLERQGLVESSGSKWRLTGPGDDELERRFPGCSRYYAKKRVTKKKKKKAARKRPSKAAKVVTKARRAVARAKTRAKKWYAGRRGVWRA